MKKRVVIVVSLLLSVLYSMMVMTLFSFNPPSTSSVLLKSDSMVMVYWCQVGVFKESSSYQNLKQLLLSHQIEVFVVSADELMHVVVSPSTDRSAAVSVMGILKELNVDALLKEGVMTLEQKQRFDHGEITSVLKEVIER